MDLSGQLHASAALSPGKDFCIHWMEGWVVTRTWLDAVAKTK
jgi:hypothetical protein